MYYHASQIGGITVLQPKVSNHSLVYFSKKRENVLVYLSNAVEKFCVENGFEHSGAWQKWASYGFDKDGILRVEEYYQNALSDTYKGVCGYIYSAEKVNDSGFETKIPDAIASSEPVSITECEYVADAYDAILIAEKQGLIRITRFEQLSDNMLSWIEKTIKEEYKNSSNHPDYLFFLENKFKNYIK